MAVCGRCFLCGHKFSGWPIGHPKTDLAFEWVCDRICQAENRHSEPVVHKMCAGCHDRLADGTISEAVKDLMALLERRQDPG